MTYRGVNKTPSGKFEALFFRDGEPSRLGVFESEVDAAIVYDLTAKATFGDFAVALNFPDLTEDDALALAPSPATAGAVRP
jgi:hypothetical protein